MRRRLYRLALNVIGAVVLADAVYLAWLWPDWHELATGKIPKSAFIEEYEERRAGGEKLPKLRWTPVALKALPEHVTRAFLLAEDAGFFLHRGIDWDAVFTAFGRNVERGRVTHGGSTITQQTAKNLFLSRERSLLRKWHELVLTWGIERNLSKQRILELYVNVVELGEGVYGVEAAARKYWGIGAAELTLEQVIELAATLPSPIHHNPATRSDAFQRRRMTIHEHVQRFGARSMAGTSAQ